MKTEKLKGTKAHQRYVLSDGTRVPGVTTVLGLLNKPALVKWANNLGLQGIDSSKYVDETAKIGTLAHEMIQNYLGGPIPDFSMYSPEQIDRAENAVLSFYEWERQTGFHMKTSLIEQQMVSETLKFGGTIDWYGFIGNERWLIDIKTSKAVYDEHRIQVSAYWGMMVENGYPLEGARILRVGRTEDEGFDDIVLGSGELDLGYQFFGKLMDVYYTKKELEKYQRRCA